MAFSHRRTCRFQCIVLIGMFLIPISLRTQPRSPVAGAAAASGGDTVKSLHKLTDVNSTARDNTPVVSADGTILYFNSTRKGNRSWAQYDSLRDKYDEDIYYARRSPTTGQWGNPTNLGAQINTSRDDAVSSLSPDGQTMYFTSLKKGWQDDGGPFYRAMAHGVSWTQTKGLGGGITRFFVACNHNFRIYGGSISPDGKEFYFATTAHSAFGNHEIWVSQLNDNGEWSVPHNLGTEINNGEGSYAPFIAADGVTLYFASRRAGGMGGDDIWMSVNRGDRWTMPRNLGPTINTEWDESFPSLTASGDIAYFSRLEPGGDDDIYAIDLPEEFRPSSVVLLKGSIKDRSTGMVIGAEVTIQDLKTGKIIDVVRSNPVTGQYTAVLHPGITYGVSVRTDDTLGYVPQSDYYEISAHPGSKQFSCDFLMEKMKVGVSYKIANIFFGVNSTSLLPESVPELQRLAAFMRVNQKLRIEVGGHTDNIGQIDYNERLSLNRANSVREYLINKEGIDVSRIQTKGYGPLNPIAPNTTREGRKKNRRTEITILEM